LNLLKSSDRGHFWWSHAQNDERFLKDFHADFAEVLLNFLFEFYFTRTKKQQQLVSVAFPDPFLLWTVRFDAAKTNENVCCLDLPSRLPFPAIGERERERVGVFIPFYRVLLLMRVLVTLVPRHPTPTFRILDKCRKKLILDLILFLIIFLYLCLSWRYVKL